MQVAIASGDAEQVPAISITRRLGQRPTPVALGPLAKDWPKTGPRLAQDWPKTGETRQDMT
jgi:hypothetical protein